MILTIVFFTFQHVFYVNASLQVNYIISSNKLTTDSDVLFIIICSRDFVTTPPFLSISSAVYIIIYNKLYYKAQLELKTVSVFIYFFYTS